MRYQTPLLITAMLAFPCAAEVGSIAKYGQSDNLEAARLVRVKPGIRHYFYDEQGDGCPRLVDRCKRKAYVVPGDVLIATESGGNFTSVEIINSKGVRSHGAVETAALEVLNGSVPSSLEWTGHWRRDSEAHIGISLGQSNGTLKAQGTALWGTKDLSRVNAGAVHTGEISGEFKPQDEWGGIVEKDSDSTGMASVRRIEWIHHFPFNTSDTDRCQLRLRLLRPYLLVYDDGNNCGGINVSFTGLYR